MSISYLADQESGGLRRKVRLIERSLHAFMVLFLFTVELAPNLHADESVTVTDLSGTKISGNLRSWSVEQVVIESPAERKFRPADVRSIKFDAEPLKGNRDEPTVWLSNGDRINARSVGVGNDLLTVSWPVLGEAVITKIPLEEVIAMILEWPATSTDRLRLITDFETLPGGSDLVVLKNGDRLLGEVDRVDAAFVELKVAGKPLKFDRSRVRAIRLNPELVTVKRPTAQRAILSLTDGSRLTVTQIEFSAAVLRFKSSGLGNVVLPVSAAVSCHLFGNRLIPITDYEPVNVEYTPYFSAKWPLIRNANVQRGPLMLRDTEFVTGLGMHSRTAVTYDLRGIEREFQATVGIDDAAKGAGSVIFAVELDGRRIWTSPELTGKSPATTIGKIDLRGVKQLTLLVDFGELADVSDYADWCDAVLIVDPNP
jgi:NPCBM/NEW2 domain